MLKAYKFGAWLPDDATIGKESLDLARNTFPTKEGYRPVPSFEAITPALGEPFQGGAAFVGSDGTAALLAGTETDLYRFSGSAWSSLLDSLTAGRWRFSQFGDNVIGVHGGAPVSMDLVGGTAAALGGSPPDASLITTVRDFVVLGKIDGDILSVGWSGFNDSEGWVDGVNQSGSQQMLDGGEVTGLAGGEYGLILQRNAVTRMTYVGAPVVFQFDQIASGVGIGPMAEGSVAQWGRAVFYLSEQGFMATDGNTVRPIGDEKVDRTFFASYSREDLENIYAAIDPRNNVVMWSMPGTPGRIWAYHWALDRWTAIETSLTGVFAGFTANVSLDALDALYPSGIDSIPVSLDSPLFTGGNPLLLIANAESEIGSLSGDNLTATLTLPNVEPAPGYRCMVRAVRPITDATDVAIAINARARPGDAENIRNAASMRANGEMPVRANGRYLGIETNLSGDWSFVQGLEMFFEKAGLR